MKRTLAALIALLCLSGTAISDGFHSPLLRNKDPRRWAQTERERLGLDSSDSAEGGARADGFDRRAAAGKLLDVLKYLDRKNVLLREFPDFNYNNIPTFKSETESLLIAIGKDAVPLLVETLITNIKQQDRSQNLKVVEDFKERVIRILIAIGEDSLSRVMASIEDPDSRVPRVMLRIVRGIVKDPDFGKSVEGWKRWYGIWQAGRRRRLAAVPGLVATLADTDRRIRLAAVQALGRIGSKKAVPALLAELEDRKDETSVTSLIRALAKIGDVSATPALIDLLESPHPPVREEAVTGLRFLTREMRGYWPKDPPEKRAAAVARWRAWWAKRSSGK
ncbi:MAG: HEAT repeat domain-containing protein [Planctomycetota bacterium]|jgi:hypothetical protein